MVKTKVIVPKLQDADKAYAPRVLNRLGPLPGGLFLNTPQKGKISFAQIRGLCAFSYARDKRRKTALLLYLKKNRRPFLVGARDLMYTAFPDVGGEPSVSAFRGVILYICKQSALTIDKPTHAFLTGLPLQFIGRDLIKLATAMGRQTEPKSMPKTKPKPQPGHDFPELENTKSAPAPSANPYAAAFPELKEKTQLDDTVPSTPSPFADDTVPGVASPFAADGDKFDTVPGAPTPITRRMTCPQCGTVQDHGVECIQCGVIVEKYAEILKRRQEAAEAERAQAPLLPQVPTEPAPELEPDPEPQEEPSPPMDYEELLAGRFMSIDTTFKLAFQLISSNFLPLLAISFIVTTLGAVVLFVSNAIFTEAPMLGGVMSAIIAISAYSLLMLSLTIYMDRVLEGERPGIVEALQDGIQILPAALASRALAAVLTFLGWLAFLFPAVVYGVRYAFIETATAVERGQTLRILTAGLSLQMGKSYFFSILGTLGLSVAIILALFYAPLGIVTTNFVLQSLSSAQADISTIRTITQIIVVLATFLCSSLGAIFLAAVLLFLYSELKALQGETPFQESPVHIDTFTKIVLLIDLVVVVWILARTL